MATTGYLSLFPGGVGSDGTGTINNAAALSYEVSVAGQTSNTPKATALKLLFDGTTDEHWMFSLLIPGDYSSGGTIRGEGKATSATTGNVIMKAGQVTSVDASSDDDALAFAAGDLSAAIAAPGVQGQTVPFTITLTTTNMAANRQCRIFVGRDADNASDTMNATDFEVLSLNFEYVRA